MGRGHQTVPLVGVWTTPQAGEVVGPWAKLITGRVEGTTGGRGWSRQATGGADTTAWLDKLMRGTEVTLTSLGSTPN